MRAALIAVLNIAFAARDPEQTVSGDSMLQNVLRSDALQNLEEQVETRSEDVAGTKIISHTANGKSAKDWIVMMAQGASQLELSTMSTNLPEGASSPTMGQVSGGGIPFFIFRGTKTQLEEKLHSTPNHGVLLSEEVQEWSVEPRTPEDNPAGIEFDDALLLERRPWVPWSVDRIDARRGRNNKYEIPSAYHDGKGVHVFLMDTGILTTHPEFQGRAFGAIEILGDTVMECAQGDTSCAQDQHGHGTSNAGIIGSTTFGAARQVTLHSAKVLGANGRGKDSWFVAGLDWIVRSWQRPAVAMCSATRPIQAGDNLSVLGSAIQRTVGAGVPVVVSAGNWDQPDNLDMRNACFHAPANVASAITVGATDHMDQRMAGSNDGPCVDIFAPGQSVTTTSLTYRKPYTDSGVQRATALVTSAVALFLSQVPTRTPAEVLYILRAMSTKDILKGLAPGTMNELLYVGEADESVGVRGPQGPRGWPGPPGPPR